MALKAANLYEYGIRGVQSKINNIISLETLFVNFPPLFSILFYLMSWRSTTRNFPSVFLFSVNLNMFGRLLTLTVKTAQSLH